MSQSFTVVSSGYPLFAELAAMLADSLRRHRTHAETSIVPGPVERRITVDSGAVVIVGGHDVRTIEVRDQAGARPFVAYWALDPFPPPELEASALDRGLRYASAHARARGMSGGLRRLLPDPLKQPVAGALQRVVTGRRSLFDREVAAEGGIERATFQSLVTVTRAVASGELDHVMVTNANSARTLRRQGVEAARVPVGYHPWMGVDEGRARDLDVLYLGLPVGRREERLRVLEAELRARGITSTRLFDAWGAVRSGMLNRAKIVVHFGRDSWHPALIRFVFAGACGAMVVAEGPLQATEPFVPGEHYIEATPSELSDAVAHYVRDTGDRARIVANAGALLATEVTMAAAVRHLEARLGSA